MTKFVNKKPLPIGVEDFCKLRKEDYYYVDKTNLIKELLDQKGDVNLFLRPRRFGKTLNLSMLKYYFEKPIGQNQDNSYLFEGTKIWTAGEKYRKEFAKYPVVNLSLKNAVADNFEDMFEKFKEIIEREYARHEYLLNSDKLSERNKKEFRQIIGQETNSKAKYENSLLKLIDLLHQHYDDKVIIIIDEYDAPLQRAFSNKFYSEAIGFVTSFLGSAMKTNEHMQFGIMSGCMRILKESFFTGFNNLSVNTILDADYDEYFGFTQTEVEDMVKYYEIGDKQKLIEDWYNGYKFGLDRVYNPWSLINYVKKVIHNPDLIPEPYWKNTSSNSLVKDMIQNSDHKTKNTLEKLIRGDTIELALNPGIIYHDLENLTEDKILNLFFFSGYLTQTDVKTVNDDKIYTLKIPNREIKKIYEGIVGEWFEEKVRELSMSSFYNKVLQGDAENFAIQVSSLLGNSINFHNYNEQFYHGFITGLFQRLEGYKIESNVISGDGIWDLALIPKISRNQPAVIMEFKMAKKDDFVEMGKKCKEALQQIEKKKYDMDLKRRGIEKLVKYGISFCGTVCQVECAK